MSKVVKTLRWQRHADKDSEWISMDGLQQAANSVEMIDGQSFTDVFFGPLPRTLQTLTAMMTGNPDKFDPEINQHGCIDQICTLEMATDLVTPKVKELMSGDKPLNPKEAVCKGHSAQQIVIWKEILATGVKIMLNKMKGEHGLAIGHTLLIPFAAEQITGLEFDHIETMEYIDFQLMEDDTIMVRVPDQFKK